MPISQKQLLRLYSEALAMATLADELLNLLVALEKREGEALLSHDEVAVLRAARIGIVSSKVRMRNAALSDPV